MTNLVSVKYIGHLPGVEVDLDGLGEQTVLYEETVQVDADTARSLLEQHNNWQLVPLANPTSKKEAEEAK